jgi:hypothetical protein
VSGDVNSRNVEVFFKVIGIRIVMLRNMGMFSDGLVIPSPNRIIVLIIQRSLIYVTEWNVLFGDSNWR